ncbi:hypothetical protein CDD81_4352 [Ophiocordyceps australis]|uniref:Uncharacterized protein n=1 Tax=Ophiocordyceps australis TaxID=1399860 RepID=A0A2C5XTW8_9HYPO|nr:hypothetical protein CDD81_4352 [Ophiocordyceps australis]
MLPPHGGIEPPARPRQPLMGSSSEGVFGGPPPPLQAPNVDGLPVLSDAQTEVLTYVNRLAHHLRRDMRLMAERVDQLETTMWNNNEQWREVADQVKRMIHLYKRMDWSFDDVQATVSDFDRRIYALNNNCIARSIHSTVHNDAAQLRHMSSVITGDPLHLSPNTPSELRNGGEPLIDIWLVELGQVLEQNTHNKRVQLREAFGIPRRGQR